MVGCVPVRGNNEAFLSSSDKISKKKNSQIINVCRMVITLVSILDCTQESICFEQTLRHQQHTASPLLIVTVN